MKPALDSMAHQGKGQLEPTGQEPLPNPKPDPDAMALALLVTGATWVEGNPVAPSGLLLSLRGTGASPIEAAVVLWQTGNPACMDLAMQEARSALYAGAGEWDENGFSGLEMPLRELLRMDPLFGNEVFKSCEGLTVNKTIVLNECANLKTFPDGFKVKFGASDLMLKGAKGLEALPKGLTVGRSCWISEAQPLRTLPDRFRTGNSLTLERCAGLETLGEGTKVGLGLHLSHCPSFRSLPPKLQVSRSLFISECGAWDGVLPEDAKIEGKIHVYQKGKKVFGEWGISPDEWEKKFRKNSYFKD